MLDWLRRLAEGGDAPPPEPAAPLAAHGLDFADALGSHRRWKRRLQGVVEGDVPAQLAELSQEAGGDGCELGGWIAGEGRRRFSGRIEFEDLRIAHAEFHAAAARLLALARAGEREAARASLGEGDYVRASGRLQRALARLFLHAQS